MTDLNEKLQELKKQKAEKAEEIKAKAEKTAPANDGWSTADNIPVKDVDEQKPVELETRIVTEVLSADLNPFNIDPKKNQ